MATRGENSPWRGADFGKNARGQHRRGMGSVEMGLLADTDDVPAQPPDPPLEDDPDGGDTADADVGFAARYGGTCAACGGRYTPSELIIRNLAGQYEHAGMCTDDDDLMLVTPPRPGEVRCDRCFLYHVGECL
jgi:hypothetical protein